MIARWTWSLIVVSWWRTATGCWARSTTPRTWAGDDAARMEGTRPVRPHTCVRSDLAVPDRDERVPDRAGSACAAAVAVTAGCAERRSFGAAHAGVRHPLAPAFSRRAVRHRGAVRHAAGAGGGHAGPAPAAAGRP